MARPRCQGFGNTIDFDLDLVIPTKRNRWAKALLIPGKQAQVPARVDQKDDGLPNRKAFRWMCLGLRLAKRNGKLILDGDG